MKNIAPIEADDSRDELLPEYEFDYQKARPNRFATRMEEEPVIVILEPDVAQVFRDSETVNALLRSLIEAMPQS
ncbi:MAG: hypothetical protein MAG431_01413 [Chloroflexi bacterium]|nr:hypothetical protein [Chloroflexota bacterium]